MGVLPLLGLVPSSWWWGHWRKPNLYGKAIELVCGGSPIFCVLVERKAQHRGMWRQQHTELVWISCLYNTNVQSWVKCIETI